MLSEKLFSLWVALMYKCCYLVVILFFITLLSTSLAAESSSCEITIKHPLLQSPKDKLIFKLLTLSIDKVTKNVCYQQVGIEISEARASKFIEKGLIDLQWSSADSFADELLIPINVPIFKGILGYRIFVIKQGEQHLFDKIETLADLQGLTAGQGIFWGDTKILQQAGLPVVTSTNGRSLWHMLALGRFDYFPLAIYEPWIMLETRPELNLVAEEKLILAYPMALLFYVNKQNTQLHQIIEKGMKIAIEDGSYDAVLKASEMIQLAAKYANLDARKIIYLQNPNLSTADELLDYKKQTEELLRLITRP
ncbi:hypothetical protein [Catenovulum maritimum]|uniref:hypothetical protein n=1 Tax=Catenovulum maritimum TaxID=1513271 RepID=UPI000660C093|nr:hypothetical protein [Catenovulum maritimum]